jgi:hypothetical protein
MIRHYYYAKQLKSCILGFSNVFAGLQVVGGLDGAGNPVVMDVPVRYGSTDRVTAALAAGNTQNKLHTIPMMSSYMTGLELAPDRMHGVNQVNSRNYLEQGGIFPDDLKTMQRVMPIPYNMQMELAIYASNTDQMFQILEQILMLFDYNLQLQFNDAPFDWTRITSLLLTGIQNEENYPMGVDRRVIVWTLNFEMPIWLSPPLQVRTDAIKSIAVRIGDLAALTLDEVDANGNLVPFSTPDYVSFIVSGYQAGSFVVGITYSIATIGNTDFTLIGASANTVGLTFTATGAGTGTGVATLVSTPVTLITPPDPGNTQIAHPGGGAE